MAYVIGIDGGTESLRAHVFDLSGRARGVGKAAYATRFPVPGQAEQNPDDWWHAAGVAVHEAMAAAGVPPAQITAIACDTTSCTVVALDADGRPLRPCLLWMDVRAHREAADVAASGDPALRLNGGGAGPVSPEWMIPKALWLKRHQPDLWARAAMVGEYQDFLTLRLTGRWVASLNNATMRWHYQTGHGGWPDSLLARLDLADLRQKWPATLAAPGAVIGPLTPDAARHLGLPPGTPVVQGGADAFIGMIGLGVTQPGDLALITGSSHLQLGVAARPVHAAGNTSTSTRSTPRPQPCRPAPMGCWPSITFRATARRIPTPWPAGRSPACRSAIRRRMSTARWSKASALAPAPSSRRSATPLPPAASSSPAGQPGRRSGCRSMPIPWACRLN